MLPRASGPHSLALPAIQVGLPSDYSRSTVTSRPDFGRSQVPIRPRFGSFGELALAVLAEASGMHSSQPLALCVLCRGR